MSHTLCELEQQQHSNNNTNKPCKQSDGRGSEGNCKQVQKTGPRGAERGGKAGCGKYGKGARGGGPHDLRAKVVFISMDAPEARKKVDKKMTPARKQSPPHASAPCMQN